MTVYCHNWIFTLPGAEANNYHSKGACECLSCSRIWQQKTRNFRLSYARFPTCSRTDVNIPHPSGTISAMFFTENYCKAERFLLFLFHTSSLVRLLFWWIPWNKVLSRWVASLLWMKDSHNTALTPREVQWSNASMLITTTLLIAVYHPGRVQTHTFRHRGTTL